MTKEQRYLEVKRTSEKRLNGAKKRRTRAFIVRGIFAVGVAAALVLAVIGTQPKNAAKLKRTLFSVTSVFSGGQQQQQQGVLDDLPSLVGDNDA